MRRKMGKMNPRRLRQRAEADGVRSFLMTLTTSEVDRLSQAQEQDNKISTHCLLDFDMWDLLKD